MTTTQLLHSESLHASSLDLRGIRTLLVHEWIYAWAGGERCLEELLNLLPHADVAAGIVTPQMRQANAIAARSHETWLGRIPGARSRHRWFIPLHPLAFRSIDTRGYDLVISISHSFGKAVRAQGGGAHLCYCLTPPRYLWDMRDAHERMASPLQRAALHYGGGVLRGIDRRTARGVDRFVSISRFIAQRVRRCYARESAVVYPPVRQPAAPRGASSGERADRPFLLSLGRLVPYKRVDLAIQAAERLQMKLVVAGDGPERASLEKLAGPHTEFVGAVSEMEADRLLRQCSAFIFCAEDDFGIAPVDANAHGAPVVAFARGGATETMVEEQTAIFFEQPSVESVAEAISKCTSRRWDADVLRANAARFSAERFQRGMRAEIARLLKLA